MTKFKLAMAAAASGTLMALTASCSGGVAGEQELTPSEASTASRSSDAAIEDKQAQLEESEDRAARNYRKKLTGCLDATEDESDTFATSVGTMVCFDSIEGEIFAEQDRGRLSHRQAVAAQDALYDVFTERDLWDSYNQSKSG